MATADRIHQAKNWSAAILVDQLVRLPWADATLGLTFTTTRTIPEPSQKVRTITVRDEGATFGSYLGR
jgi:hypothetical protein